MNLYLVPVPTEDKVVMVQMFAENANKAKSKVMGSLPKSPTLKIIKDLLCVYDYRRRTEESSLDVILHP